MSLFDGVELPENVGGETVPAGKYQALVELVKYDATKEPNQFSVQYIIQAGPMENQRLWSNYRMTKEKGGLSYLLKDCNLFDIQAADIGTEVDLVKVFNKKAVGKTVGLTVKHTPKADGGGVWVNTYLNDVTLIGGGPNPLDEKDDIEF